MHVPPNCVSLLVNSSKLLSFQQKLDLFVEPGCLINLSKQQTREKNLVVHWPLAQRQGSSLVGWEATFEPCLPPKMSNIASHQKCHISVVCLQKNSAKVNGQQGIGRPARSANWAALSRAYKQILGIFEFLLQRYTNLNETDGSSSIPSAIKIKGYDCCYYY